MAKSLLLGWGQYLGQYLNIPVVNQAVGGESARSYSDHGRFVDCLIHIPHAHLVNACQVHHSRKLCQEG